MSELAIRALAAFFLLFVPGYLAALFWLPRRNADERLPLVEAVFGGVALSVVVTALVAHNLAYAGAFTPRNLFAVVALVSAGLLGGLLATGRSLWPLSLAGGALYNLAPLALLAALLAAYHPPTQFVWGSGDEGVYTNAALEIAHSGSFFFRDEVLDSLPAALTGANLGSLCQGFHFLECLRDPALGPGPDHGVLIPHAFHFFPSWLAALKVAGGLPLMFAGTIALTLIAVLGLYLMAARFAGPFAGLFAAGLFGIDPAAVWFARVTNAEAMTLMLLVSGFALFTLGVPAQEPGSERRASLAKLFSAGLLLGTVHLAKIEFFLLPWAVLLSAVLLLAAGYRARAAAALPIGYVLILALATFHAFQGHRVYFHVQLFNPETFGKWNARLFIGSFVAALACALAVFALRRELPRLVRLPLRRIVIALGAVTALLAVYLYWGLPLQAEWGTRAPEELASWQRALAVTPELVEATKERSWREITFWSLGLYVTTLGVFCGVVGAFLLLLRKECLPLAPFICMVLVQTAFFLLVSGRLDYGSANPHTPGRRFLSLTIPGFVALSVLPWFVYARAAGPRAALALRVLGTVACAVMGAQTWYASVGLVRNPRWTTAVATIRTLASKADDKVVWIQAADDGVADHYITPLRFMMRQKIFVLGSHISLEEADALLASFQNQGWTPVLLSGFIDQELAPRYGIQSDVPEYPTGRRHLLERLRAEGRGNFSFPEDAVNWQRFRIPDDRMRPDQTYKDLSVWDPPLTYYGALPHP